MLHAKMSATSMFKEIIVIPCVNNSTNLIILTGYTKQTKANQVDSLHEDVSMALRAMDNPDELKELWLPQFKTAHSTQTDAIVGLTEESKPYEQQTELELYTLPKSDGTPEVAPS